MSFFGCRLSFIFARASRQIRCIHSRGSFHLQAKSRAQKVTSKKVSASNASLPQSQEQWSIVAYNLSEELRIDHVTKLLDKLKDYQVQELPEDLQDEAVLLRGNSSKCNSPYVALAETKPLNDIFLFREGCIVFWGVPYSEQRKVLQDLSSLEVDPYSSDLTQEEREHLEYDLAPAAERSRMNKDIVQLGLNQDPKDILSDQFALSHAVALSVKLGIWEIMLVKYIDSIGWVTNCMKKGDSIGLTRSQVFCKTGELYELKHRINLSSDLLDLPDVYWDRHDQEVLFLSLTSFLNIKKRTSVMNEKLNNCCELMNLLAGHMNDKHHIRLEWMIIVLITVEVLFEVARLF